tara:strand:- start:1055 stop:1258 length:204 start_codon:yes stop_codon:yes gene_type:complete
MLFLETEMLNVEEIRAALQDRVLTVVAREAGVNRNTLAMIRNGRETNLTTSTIKALSDYLAPKYGAK